MIFLFCFFNQKTAYEMRISDWSSDVCSSDLRLRTVGADLYRDLIGGATDTARAHLEMRLHVAQRVVEQLDRIVAGALLHQVEGPIDAALCGRLLAVQHDAVHELAHTSEERRVGKE